jgi:hypothetical protein
MRKLGWMIALPLAGCVSHAGIRPLRPLEIATAPYRGLATEARAGSLMYEGGCLLFRDDRSGAIVMPVWPSGSIFNGTALVFHEPGKTDQRIMVAEEFLMSGLPEQWAALGGPVYGPIQHQCGAYAPFFVSSVRPAN